MIDSSPLGHAIRRLTQGSHLSGPETAEAFGVLMRGEAGPAQIAALLMGLRVKGETSEEIAGAAQALRAAMVRLPVADVGPLVDTCGTGGGRLGTFNISTAAAFVVAAAGAPIAKHGNRSYTSRCGSADVLEALGIEISLPPQAAARVLERAGMVFLFAPTYHPAMRHVGPTRKELGVPTVMNLLGPLVNPAGVRRQVLGVAEPERGVLVAEALLRLGATHTLVVHAEVGMDEISPGGRTLVWEVREGRVASWVLDPAVYGLAHGDLESLAGGDPAENATRVQRLLEGESDEAARRAVLLNAAAGIYVSGREPTLARAVERAREALAGGAARAVLETLRQVAGRAPVEAREGA
ncbi:MAG: anthranilate phosphoribosyltransferase [Gemmatimonadales bacterium]